MRSSISNARISIRKASSVHQFSMFKRNYSILSNFFKPNYEFIDSNGNTALHLQAKNYSNFDKFSRFVCEVGKEPASVMSRTVNDRGLLPMDLLEKNVLYRGEKKTIAPVIEPMMEKLMTNIDIKPISEPINIDEILKRYYSQKDEPFYPLIQPVCKLANEVRTTILESSTHPQYDHYTPERQAEINDTIEKNRKQRIYRGRTYANLCENALTAARDGVGNCSEFTNLFLYKFMNQSKLRAFGDRYSIMNGDHSFSLIRVGSDTEIEFDTDLLSGKNKLICDVLYGDAYPPCEIKKRLHDHRTFERNDFTWYNVLTLFNANYHVINKTTPYLDHQDVSRKYVF